MDDEPLDVLVGVVAAGAVLGVLVEVSLEDSFAAGAAAGVLSAGFDDAEEPRLSVR